MGGQIPAAGQASSSVGNRLPHACYSTLWNPIRLDGAESEQSFGSAVAIPSSSDLWAAQQGDESTYCTRLYVAISAMPLWRLKTQHLVNLLL